MKMNGLTAIALLELLHGPQDMVTESQIVDLCDPIVAARSASGYFQDAPGMDHIHFWGYHQLLAVARAGRLLGRHDYLEAVQGAVDALIEPAARDLFYYSWPPADKNGLTAYCVTPLVQGLAELYRATGHENARELALQGCAWFTGLNDRGLPLYDPSTGSCIDGLDQIGETANYGAESAVEAGFAEVERRDLVAQKATFPDSHTDGNPAAPMTPPQPAPGT